ncbi:hypothetical protein Glove_360g76 [Diversispora epigaea]|uniref:Uncharacterized protein n=1 Tax=Diversispora epigaea TaxID=1348612 RepID=A0A397HA52_9GLOM|nr:hypothetical protein Glove_360g76 [Diversispora epigaea]
MQNNRDILMEFNNNGKTNINISSLEKKTVVSEKVTTRKLNTIEKRLKKKRMMVYKPKNYEMESITSFFQPLNKEDRGSNNLNESNQVIATDMLQNNTNNKIYKDPNNVDKLNQTIIDHASNANELKDSITIDTKQDESSTSCSRKEELSKIENSTNSLKNSHHISVCHNTCQDDDYTRQDEKNTKWDDQNTSQDDNDTIQDTSQDDDNVRRNTSQDDDNVRRNTSQDDNNVRRNTSQDDNNTSQDGNNNASQDDNNASRDVKNISQDGKDRNINYEILSSNAESSKSQLSKLTSSFRGKEKGSNTCICALCSKDLTKFGIVTREAHLNRCLEKVEIIDVDEENDKNRNDKKEIQSENSNIDNIKSFDISTLSNQKFPLLSTITICPCCQKKFSSRIKDIKGKMNHVKKCGNKQGYTVTKMLSLLQELAQDVASRKDTQLTNYFSSKQKEERTATVSRTYQVSSIEGLDQDTDFKSNVVITAVSIVEEKRKKRKVEEDSDDDFRMAKVLSLSEARERNRKRWMNKNKKRKVVYTLETTPIIPPSESIAKARRRAQHMFFKKRTMKDIVKRPPTPTFGPSKLAKRFEYPPINLNKDENEIITKTQRKSLWKIQALGGPESTLTNDDYITDMLRNAESSYLPPPNGRRFSSFTLRPFRRRFEICSRCINKYWGRLPSENEPERDENVERNYYYYQ